MRAELRVYIYILKGNKNLYDVIENKQVVLCLSLSLCFVPTSKP